MDGDNIMWTERKTWVENRYLNVEIEMQDLKDIPEEYILRELSQKIADKIIQKNYYVLEKNETREDPFNNTKIRYRMYVALDPEINQNTIRIEKAFKVNDVEFTDKEIEKALIKTYPHKLI
jgi:hypothetical protein